MSDQPDTISVGRADARNLMSRLRRRELHRLVQRELRAWTRRLRTWTWPDSFSLKEDIKCKEISSIDAVHNRTMTLACKFKGMNDELEEDEDLHNKMKYDHMMSDEQITTDNAKISTLETNISAKSASVAQLTDEIDMLENDSKQVQAFRCDRDYGKAFGLSSQQSTTEDIDHNSKRRSYCSKEQPRDEGVVRVCPAVYQSER